MKIQAASHADIAALTKLVNSAYRGESSRQGWTHEADLFNSNRMDQPTLRNMMDQPGTTIFKMQPGDEIIACVLLRREEELMYLGMLTVSPLLQGQGTGKTLMRFAEDYAKQQGCSAIYMRVIDCRDELLQWYHRQGYADTGERIPFKGDGRDVPNQEINFAILRKAL